MLIMFSMGLTLALRDFAMVARQPKPVAAGLLRPISWCCRCSGSASASCSGFRRNWRSACSSSRSARPGTTSNALTFVGRGNVALAVILTALDQPGHRVHHSAAAELGGAAVPQPGKAAPCRRCRCRTRSSSWSGSPCCRSPSGMIVRHFAPDFADAAGALAAADRLRRPGRGDRRLGAGQPRDGASHVWSRSRPRSSRSTSRRWASACCSAG